MKKKYITVREWIKHYEAGKYDDPSFNVQCSAGWNDWFCPDSELLSKLKKLAKLIIRIEDDFILDNYTLTFYNNYPLDYPLYDQIRFTPINYRKYKNAEFGIECDHPCGSEYMYEIFTARNDYKTEFKCKDIDEVLNAVHKIAYDLSAGNKRKSSKIAN